jgi:hypothetical protein
MAKRNHKFCKYTRIDIDQMIFVLQKCVKHDLTESDVMSRCIDAARRGREPDFSRKIPGYLKGKVKDSYKDPARIKGYRLKLQEYKDLKKKLNARN